MPYTTHTHTGIVRVRIFQPALRLAYVINDPLPGQDKSADGPLIHCDGLRVYD